MRATLSCPRCRSPKLWHLARVPDATTLVTYELSIYTSADGRVLAGGFELFVCAACGLCEWYGVELEALATTGTDEAALRVHEMPPCSKCGERRIWQVHPMRELASTDEPGEVDAVPMALAPARVRPPPEADGPELPEGAEGAALEPAVVRPDSTFETRVCSSCGFTRWFAHDLALIEAARADFRREQRPCAVCDGEELWTLTPQDVVIGAGSHPRFLGSRAGLWKYFTRRGRLESSICFYCGHAEWNARELEDLAEDPARGLRKVTASMQQGNRPSTPYR